MSFPSDSRKYWRMNVILTEEKCRAWRRRPFNLHDSTNNSFEFCDFEFEDNFPVLFLYHSWNDVTWKLYLYWLDINSEMHCKYFPLFVCCSFFFYQMKVSHIRIMFKIKLCGNLIRQIEIVGNDVKCPGYVEGMTTKLYTNRGWRNICVLLVFGRYILFS